MGIELATSSPENSIKPAPDGARCGAPTPTNLNIDANLAALIDGWGTLPEPIRAGILARIQAAGK